MTVYRNESQWDTSNVEFAAAGSLRYDKTRPTPDMTPHRLRPAASSTAEALSPATRRTSRSTSRDVYQELLAERQLAGYEVHQRFYEIGSPAGLEETRQRSGRRRRT